MGGALEKHRVGGGRVCGGGGKGGISGQSVEPRGGERDRIGIFKDEMFLDHYHRIYQYPLKHT